MIVTSAEANKELKKLTDELARMQAVERQSMTFVAATSEDIESVRPEYFFISTQEKIEKKQEEIRRIKHAINQFNVTHKPEGFDMTVDEMLVYIPQLSALKSKYQDMARNMEKKRLGGGLSRGALIEYEYVNYDIAEAKGCLEYVTTELSRAQIALDKLNTTVSFEINI